MFVYQPTFNVLELKNSKGTEYIVSWKSKEIYNSKLIALHGTFLPNVKHFRNKIGIQFNSAPLAIEQNNYATKILEVYIVYDLDNWPINPLSNFTLKICLFRLTNVVKDNGKEKYVYRGYRIAFDGKRSWSFNDDFTRNVIIFGVDNSSSSHSDNLKNDFLILGEGDTFGINGSFGAPQKN